MEAFLVSASAVAISEIADKTQLLAFVLAARFRKPLPIILGILVATLANHAIAAAVGKGLTGLVSEDVLRLTLGLSFFGIAVWALLPDRLATDETSTMSARGAFGASVVAFFLAEMGDKTQIATVVLAAKYASVLAVLIGTTLGMVLANAPPVYFGNRLARVIPLRPIRLGAAAIFAVLGALALLS